MNFNFLYKNKSLSTKFTWFISLIVLFSVSTVSFLSISSSKKSLRTASLLYLGVSAKEQENTIDNYFKNIKESINFYARSQVIQENIHYHNIEAALDLEREKNCIQFLNKFKKFYKFQSIRIYGRKGYLHSSNKDIIKNTPLPELKPNEFKFGKPFSENGMSCLNIYKRIDNENGLLGTIVVQVDLDDVFKLIAEKSNLGETGEVLIAIKDEEGALFINPLRFDKNAAFRRKALAGSTSSIPILNAVEGKNGMKSTIDYRNEKVIAVWRFISIIDCGIVAKMDEKEIFKPIYNLQITIILWSILILIIGIILSFLFSKILAKAIQQLHVIIQTLSQGDKAPHITESKSNNEIGQMINASIKLARFQKNIIEFTQNISTKNFAENKKIKINKGELGRTLLSMEQNLIKIEKESEIKNWTNEGIVKFSTIIRDFSNDVNTFSSILISELVQYLGCLQGGIFALNEENTVLDQVSFYAFDRAKFEQHSLQKGDGLLWQAIEEKEYILLTEIPNDYINISSGLGKEQPSSILIIPLIINKIVYGIIELASFKKIEAYNLAFLKIISENIAGALANTKINKKSEALLAISKEKNQKLFTQEKELEQRFKEMQLVQEELNHTKDKIETKEAMLLSIVNTSENTYFCIDQNYRILIANDTLRNRMKTNGTELKIGTTIFDNLDEKETKYWKKKYDRILSGESFTEDLERKVGKEILNIEVSYQPIKNNDGKIIGAAVISKDITELVKTKMRLKVLENKFNVK